MQPQHPLFSIITVTYNAADTIAATMRSVAEQTCTLYEHIIVDGLSTDTTMVIANDESTPRTRIVSQKDRGIYDAMNNGLDIANGDYVIFLNAGDRFHSPQTLQQYADAITAHDFPGIVYGQTILVDAAGRALGPRHLDAPDTLTLDSMKEGMLVCHQAMAVLRRITVPYNIKYRYSADYEWLICCLQHSRENVRIPAVVCDYLSEGTTTAHHRASLRERFRIMAHYFGLPTAIWQHIKFLPRYLRRRRNAPNAQ